MSDYSDDYPTCLETHATFRVISACHDCTQLQAAMHLEPTSCKPSRSRSRPADIWELTTEGTLTSRDTRRHVDWLLDRIEPAAAALECLRQEGAKTDIFCYFVNVGHGGPMLSVAQLVRLAALKIDISWDVYSGIEDDQTNTSQAE